MHRNVMKQSRSAKENARPSSRGWWPAAIGHDDDDDDKDKDGGSGGGGVGSSG